MPCGGGEDLLRRLFEPLGYELTVTPYPLGAGVGHEESSRILRIEVSATKRLSELLSHLYVLIPVLDNEKHYWVGDDEVAKLLRHGEGWLAGHPARELITA